MALSNLRNEPRREITETIIGVTLFVSFLLGDYGIAKMLGAKETGDLVLGMVLIPTMSLVAIGVLILLAVALHGLGDLVCGWLGRLGLDPRPKQRYRR